MALNSICILRLSAIGDVCHALPVVRTIQKTFPHAEITWIIGKTEYALLGDIPDIKFIVFDKAKKLGAYIQLKRAMQNQFFDVLLHMQTSSRANLASLFIHAHKKIGYDRVRARELQWLFSNTQILPASRQHQIDDMYGFAQALGATENTPVWSIPVPENDVAYINKLIPGEVPLLVINPCSSPSKRVHRNWLPERYAQVVDYASEKLGLTIVLCGGPSELETNTAKFIVANCKNKPINLAGKTSLKQLAALLRRATVLLSSDSGPVHIATAMGTRVIALHAATNPDQTGPYLHREWLVNKYPEALQAEYGKNISDLPWGTRVHDADAMARISVEDVNNTLARLVKNLRATSSAASAQ